MWLKDHITFINQVYKPEINNKTMCMSTANKRIKLRSVDVLIYDLWFSAPNTIRFIFDFNDIDYLVGYINKLKEEQNKRDPQNKNPGNYVFINSEFNKFKDCNGIVYVGKSSYDVFDRVIEHLTNNERAKEQLFRDIRDGDKFILYIIPSRNNVYNEKAKSNNERLAFGCINRVERELIKYFACRKYKLYNRSFGANDQNKEIINKNEEFEMTDW